MTRKQRRLILIGASVGVLAVAAALVLNALRDSIVFFNSPTDVAEKQATPGTRLRIGGLVKPGSLERGDNLMLRFAVTDGKTDLTVNYQGIDAGLVPGRTGQWRRANLSSSRTFTANTVLAKHDERYAARGGRCVEEKRTLAGRRDKEFRVRHDDAELGHYALVLASVCNRIAANHRRAHA
jgi:cytochrome c-type biogenesis protein CcmE